MIDDWKTDIVILHKIIDNHDAVIRMMAERIDVLQASIVHMGMAAENNFDELYLAVRTIAKVTVPHLVEVERTPKPNLRMVSKDDDA